MGTRRFRSRPTTRAAVSTDQHFSQAYGRFEVRAKISGATVQGLQSSFWLSPESLTYGAWPASGEIDIAELFSGFPTLAIPSLLDDGTTCLVDHWQPQSHLLSPAPFDRPFFVCQTQALGTRRIPSCRARRRSRRRRRWTGVRVWGAST